MSLTLATSHDTQETLDTAPANIDAEQAFLGALLFDNEVYHAVSDWLNPSHFFDPVHGRIYETACELIGAGALADAVALKSRFDRDESLETIGGTEYLAVLIEGAATSKAAVEYARIVYDLARRREVIGIADDVGHAARQDAEVEVADLIELAEARLSAMTELAEGEASFTAGEALRAALDQPMSYIETGLTGFDDIRAVAPGLTMIGGRSSMGKSALLCDLCRRSAENGKPSLLLTNEMTARQIAARWAASVTGVPYWAITNGTMHRDQADRVGEVLAHFDKLPVTIIECPGVGIAGLRSRIRRWLRKMAKQGREPGVVGIDYLQNISATGGSLYERTSDIALGLQTIQLTFDICLMVACQLARAAEKEKDKRPSIAHLRDSGKIEEVADRVMLVYRDAYYAEREPEESDVEKEMERRERAGSKLVEVDLAKNRVGALAKIKMCGDMACNRFEDWG